MKTIHWIILGLVFFTATWYIYKTRETQPRIETYIDLNWKFMQGDPAGAEHPEYDDSDWRYLSLPHDWMIEQAVRKDNPSGNAGGYYPRGVAWYRKILNVDEYADMDQFYLMFDGVMRNADVYLNGTHLGKQIYGYSSFYHDISSLIRKDTLNVIAVRSDCSKMPFDRWYSGAGIYRHVSLIATSSLHIPVWGSFVTSAIMQDGQAEISVSLDVKNNGEKARRFDVRFDLVDPHGRIVAQGKTTEYIESAAIVQARKTFSIEQPELWSPDQPGLYAVNCYLMDKNKLIDHVLTRHGIRSAEFDPDQGFLLNGNKLMMKGVNIHHDGGELGAAVPMESWRRRLSLLKELGVNALRLAYNPHAPEVLDLCDQMGFLVINEMYDKWEEGWFENDEAQFADTWKTDLGNFILRDRNHASVVLWSVGNETREQLNDPSLGVAWYSDLKELVLSIDSTRKVTAALHPGKMGDDHEIPSRMMHVSPVVSYNYRSDSFNVWHDRYPELVFIASKTKPYSTKRKEDYQEISFADNSWNNMDEFVAGQFIWAGIDYLGESAGWPDRGFRHGLLHTNGFIKPHAWYIGSQYREDPLVKLTVKDSMLADSLNKLNNWQVSWAGAPLVDHWSFENDTSLKEVVVFTNCERVEIQLNKTPIQTLERSAFADGVIKARVPYSPGELVAHAYFTDDRGRTQQVSDTLRTSHAPHSLAMHPDRRRFDANNRIVHIRTKVVDSTGTLNPHSSHLVNYQLDGPGKIKVIDNGDLVDHTPPGSNSKEVRKGKQLLVLQAGSEPGDLIVHASANGLKSSKVRIKSKD
jgi:beta-galactosidase